MKLNIKRTLLVGMAFLSISAFWQLYDNVVPLILKNTFNMRDDISGVIMALDNVLALFLLPLFGKLSDNVRTPLGKRRPFIFFGTACAVVLMNLLPVMEHKMALLPFVLVLGLLLISMGTYRSPAVALMPDVTPKPLRSKGNAIINLMGALGGVFTLVITSILVGTQADGRPDYQPLFIAVSILMVIAVLILLFFVKENKLAAEAAAINEALDAENTDVAEAVTKADQGMNALPKELRTSLMLILVSVFFWFMGYNAVTTAFTKYVSVQWGYDLADASRCLMVGTVAAVLSYLPVGILSSRFGRKRMIQVGVVILALAFTAAAFFSTFSAAVYVVFALVGVAWAMINVNSYPMVVEISKSGDVGKYTGYYYTFSMAAQIITPILSGILLQNVGYFTLMPYGAIMVAISFVTITLTRHGDSKPEPPKDKLEAFMDPE
ncbi:MAG: SLC45 family MFS transporter [Clostridiales bacterium]|nr:SLC45 family MFS transporter [Clostridiales bacterium]